MMRKQHIKMIFLSIICICVSTGNAVRKYVPENNAIFDQTEYTKTAKSQGKVRKIRPKKVVSKKKLVHYVPKNNEQFSMGEEMPDNAYVSKPEYHIYGVSGPIVVKKETTVMPQLLFTTNNENEGIDMIDYDSKDSDGETREVEFE